MSPRIEDEVRQAVRPYFSANVIRALQVDDAGQVSFVYDDADKIMPSDGMEKAERAVKAVPGVTGVVARRAAPPPDLGQTRHAPPRGIEGVGVILAIGSGKGGVGKSTVTANLALALADRGFKVGILDADIYGPSQPTMLGATGRPVGREDKLIPLSAHGIRAMSVGMLMEPGKALVWRGPILVTAMRQMLHDVIWAPLDILLVDLPPGTGDVQITLAQTVPLDGAIIVTTPQDVALIDARRAIDLFEQLDVPVVGLIENMGVHVCSRCGQEDDIFGHGGGRAEAEAHDIAFLGSLPIDRRVRETGDGGTPIVRADPDGPIAARFAEIAEVLASGLVEG